MLEYIPDILACTALYPCGVLFSYYFFSPNDGTTKPVLTWQIVSGISSCGIVAVFLNFRRLCLRRYTFDHMYFLIIGQISFIIYGIYPIFSDKLPITSRVASILGFVGHGITMLVSPTYLSLRTPKDGNRPFRIAFMYVVYFSGLVTRTGIGLLNLTITISAAVNLVGFIINEILHMKGVYSYKKSLNQEWNKANENERILKATKDIIEELENDDSIESVVEKNSQTLIVMGLLLVRTENILIFADPIYKKVTEWIQEVGINIRIEYLMIFGSSIGAFLLIFLKSKYVYAIFKIIIIVSLVCIAFEYSRAIFLLTAFIGLQGYYSIIVTSLLETSPFSCTEILSAFGYILELIAIDFLKNYQTPTQQTEMTVLLSLLAITTILFLILLFFFLPETSSLLDIKKDLISSLIQKVESEEPKNENRYYPFISTLRIPTNDFI